VDKSYHTSIEFGIKSEFNVNKVAEICNYKKKIYLTFKFTPFVPKVTGMDNETK